MMIFKGDKLLAGEGPGNYASVIPELRSRVVGSSIDLPEAWQDLPPWSEVDGTPDAFKWIDLREVWSRWGDEAFARAGVAYQYMNWLRDVKFCSRCAAPMSPRTEDKGLACSGCGRVVYAPLHPAVIVAVERDGKLLLAHNNRMPAKRYSILAGFVEPGESLEQTIEREVREEVGIEVEEVRYFGSQSWPFPCSLMLGFTACWKSGSLRADGTELSDAGWFAPGEFPEIPPSISISRKLIDDFTSRHISRG
jgi:NAD+ diphosphatase